MVRGCEPRGRRGRRLRVATVPKKKPPTAALGALGGRSDWRLPSKRELMDAAKTNPDIPDVGGKLWSRDTNPAAAGSAWTVDLDRAGASMSLDKSDGGLWGRCVSDG